jgi:hypothetical protein
MHCRVISLYRPCLLLAVLTVSLYSYARTASADDAFELTVVSMLEDLANWKASAGGGTTWATGDFNDDGSADLLDLALWKESFALVGTSGGSLGGPGAIVGSTSGSAAPTPEPGTLAMLAAGLVGGLAFAWKKRR